MKNIATFIVQLVISFIVTLILSWAINLYFQNNGQISIGPPVIVQTQEYVPVSISNAAEEPLNDVIMSVPAATNLLQIISSSPVQIENVPDVAGLQTRKRITISGLEPSKVTQLLVPVANQR